MISRKVYRKLKEYFAENKRKHDMSPTASNKTITKKLEYFFIENKLQLFFETELEQLTKHSKDDKKMM